MSYITNDHDYLIVKICLPACLSECLPNRPPVRPSVRPSGYYYVDRGILVPLAHVRVSSEIEIFYEILISIVRKTFIRGRRI